MNWAKTISAILLALAISACTAKADDHCHLHTGDGVCADNGIVANVT